MAPADLVAVFVGGAAGAWARHLITEPIDSLWGTALVNVVGTVLLALLLVRNPSRRLRLVAAVGFLGSFTTFSTFAVDAVEAGFTSGSVYVLVSVGLGWLATRLAGRR